MRVWSGPSPWASRSLCTQFPKVPAPTPSSRATSAIGLPVSQTIVTAPDGTRCRTSSAGTSRLLIDAVAWRAAAGDENLVAGLAVLGIDLVLSCPSHRLMPRAFPAPRRVASSTTYSFVDRLALPD